MAYFTDTGASAVAQPRRIAAMFDALSLKLRQRKMYRKTYDELCTLSSRDMADLGFSRGDIRRISREAAQMVK